jgi:ADP-ribosyl-[dinitrogen reductase] hydrolase
MDLDELVSRAQGAFLGLAVGDALGATTEFMTPEEIRLRFGVHRRIVGGGWLRLKPGQVTDDTQMSVALARALVKAGGWDLRRIADAFVSWLRSRPADIGATCARGLRRYLHQGTLEAPPSDWDAGNGAAMRVAPVALFSLGDPAPLERYALEQAHITHHHPLSDVACVVVARMVDAGVRGAPLAALRLLADETTRVHPGFSYAGGPGTCSPYVVDTLRTVFHALFTTRSFEECLITTVNRGGDADTSGAIAGAIAGAYYGPGALPPRWIRRLDRHVRREVVLLAEALVRLSPTGRTLS